SRALGPRARGDRLLRHGPPRPFAARLAPPRRRTPAHRPRGRDPARRGESDSGGASARKGKGPLGKGSLAPLGMTGGAARAGQISSASEKKNAISRAAFSGESLP